MQLQDKVALITGAASGIGKEIAIEYAKQGAKVVIADLALDTANKTAEEIRQSGGQAFAVAMDVTSEEQVDKGVADAAAHFGGIDVLISNAGIQIISPVVDYPFEQWKKMLAIHLDGAFLTTRACMREMIKAANVICPGFVRTPLVDKQIPEQAAQLKISEEDVIKKVMLKDTIDGEFTTTQDVAQTAIFLAAFPSNALSGQSIVVSHGWFMQ